MTIAAPAPFPDEPHDLPALDPEVAETFRRRWRESMHTERARLIARDLPPLFPSRLDATADLPDEPEA